MEERGPAFLALLDPMGQKSKERSPRFRLQGLLSDPAAQMARNPWQRQGPRDMTRQLPPDLLEMVLSKLTDVRSRNAASLVCTGWREAERATRRVLDLRGCLQDLPSLSQRPNQGLHSGTNQATTTCPHTHSGMPPLVPDRNMSSTHGPTSLQASQHVGEACRAGAPGTPLSLGSGVVALDMSLIWPWGESLLLAAPPALGAPASTRGGGAPALTMLAPRGLPQSLVLAPEGRAADTERTAAHFPGAGAAAPADAKLGSQALAVPVARVDKSGAWEQRALQTEQIVPQLPNLQAHPDNASPSVYPGLRQPPMPSPAAAQGALRATTLALAGVSGLPGPWGALGPATRIPGPPGSRDASTPVARSPGPSSPSIASGNAPRIPGLPGPRDAFDDMKQIQAVLRAAFPQVTALRVYLQSERDVSLLAGTWDPHQLQHLAPVRLALCLAGLRQRRGPPIGGAAAHGAEGVTTAPGGDGEGAQGELDMSGLTQLLRAYPRLTTLDLSQFLCLTEDIPKALSLAPGSAQGLRELSLLKIGARGLKGSELKAVAQACPQLRSLRCMGEFDARLDDPVDDAALGHLARGCTHLRHLHVVHSSLMPQPLLEQCAFYAHTPQGLETMAGEEGASVPAAVSPCPGGRRSSVPDVAWAGTSIPFDWPRFSALGPECIEEADNAAAAVATAAGGTADPEQAIPSTPVAVSVAGVRAALALLPSLVHLGLLLPGPPLAGLSAAEEGTATLPAAVPGGGGGQGELSEGGEGGRREGGGGGEAAGARRGGGAGANSSITTDTTDWRLLDLPSLCPALTSVHLCPLGAPLPATAPQRDTPSSHPPALSPLFSPSLLQLHLRAAAVSQGWGGLPSGSAEQDGKEDSASLASPMPLSPRSNLLVEIASACPRLRSLELWGCHGMQRDPLQAALRALAPSLRHLSILHCQPLPVPDLLWALDPLRPSLLSLELSLSSEDAPTSPCSPSGVPTSTLLPSGSASTSTHWKGTQSAPGAGLGAEGLRGPVGGGWAQLQRLSLWVPLGTSLVGFMPRLLGPACPRLHTVSISVGGDCRGLPGPGMEDFGLASLAAYPGLTTLLLNLSGICGYSLSCPEGSSDIDTWERFHMAGIEALEGCSAVHLWPPRDCDTQRHALSLAAASLLALCPALRGLTVHGMASEHALAQLLRSPGLRDVKLIPDCHFWGPGTGAMAHNSLSKVKRASLCRFFSNLTTKGCPD